MMCSLLPLFRNQIRPNDNLCMKYPEIDVTLFGGDTSAVLLPPLYIVGIFIGARILIGMLAMAKHVRFTGKVKSNNLFTTVFFGFVSLLYYFRFGLMR